MSVEDKRAYDRLYYHNNKERRAAQIRERNLIAIERNRSFVRDYLAGQSCVDCGFSDPRALQFDHLDPKNKHKAIADMVARAYSLDKIIAEIQKCEVVCANCHSIRTCESYGFHKAGRVSSVG